MKTVTLFIALILYCGYARTGANATHEQRQLQCFMQDPNSHRVAVGHLTMADNPSLLGYLIQNAPPAIAFPAALCLFVREQIRYNQQHNLTSIVAPAELYDQPAPTLKHSLTNVLIASVMKRVTTKVNPISHCVVSQHDPQFIQDPERRPEPFSREDAPHVFSYYAGKSVDYADYRFGSAAEVDAYDYIRNNFDTVFSGEAQTAVVRNYGSYKSRKYRALVQIKFRKQYESEIYALYEQIQSLEHGKQITNEDVKNRQTLQCNLDICQNQWQAHEGNSEDKTFVDFIKHEYERLEAPHRERRERAAAEQAAAEQRRLEEERASLAQSPQVHIFTGQHLLEQDFAGRKDLVGAHFKGANVYGVRFCGSNLQGANFQNTRLTNAHLQNTDLSY
ncbi:pentapeptide repeat-containing protein, partial [Candidatus Babeliales bacterium]|nr:pentapeptide repeat-containing protein [Candidatus Babeliales bacterium]